MVVHIPVDEKTRRELFTYRLALEDELKRPVSYDQAIRMLLDIPDMSDETAQVFLSSFGLCQDCHKEIFAILEEMRNQDEHRLIQLTQEENNNDI